MAGTRSGERLRCPRCGNGLRPPERNGAEFAELPCPACGVLLRARPRVRTCSGPDEAAAVRPPASAATSRTSEGLDLTARVLALRVLAGGYRVGLAGGALGLLALGGVVPVLGRWLRDELACWDDVVATLGGLPVRPTSKNPDADLGPVIARPDAPRLFDEVDYVARRIGARRPEQIRLTYLPCCGVTAWRRSRALVVGLPLLDVLNLAELRAVLAHELAHLARGDATGAAGALRFIEALGRTLDGPLPPSRSPLRLWARTCRQLGDLLGAPVARGQEARADRLAALVAGGNVAASALVKVALVQPLFREVLEHYDPDDASLPNLYAFFRAFWARIPEELRTAMRHRLLSDPAPITDGPHPPLLDRLSAVQMYPARTTSADDEAQAVNVLGDLEAFEQMLHNRLFGVPAVEPSLFHRAGS